LSKSLRVFVVEDEILIRMLFEDMLEELGHTVTCAASLLDEALSLAQTCEVDVAILDVRLAGKAVFPVAGVLAERGIPFLFASGITGADMPEPFRGRPTMQKPFDVDRLKDVLSRLVG
jgi:CheY-like chemotaxis protein